MCDALSLVIATGFEIGTAAADPMPKTLPKVAAAKAIDRRAIVCPFTLRAVDERTPEFVRFIIRRCLSRLPDVRVIIRLSDELQPEVLRRRDGNSCRLAPLLRCFY
jgi:hypothetical protein